MYCFLILYSEDSGYVKSLPIRAIGLNSIRMLPALANSQMTRRKQQNFGSFRHSAIIGLREVLTY